MAFSWIWKILFERIMDKTFFSGYFCQWYSKDSWTSYDQFRKQYCCREYEVKIRLVSWKEPGRQSFHSRTQFSFLKGFDLWFFWKSDFAAFQENWNNSKKKCIFYSYKLLVTEFQGSK